MFASIVSIEAVMMPRPMITRAFELTVCISISSAAITHIWGPPRVVELNRVPNQSLGISIVGGRVDLAVQNAEGATRDRKQAIQVIYFFFLNDAFR